jgi:formamidopyrimidine-DNA glycosylase
VPELPEVETVARTLREGRGAPSLVGRTIQSAKVLWPREIGNLKPRAFERRVAGLRVQSVGRRGKYLMIHLARDDRPFDPSTGSGLRAGSTIDDYSQSSVVHRPSSDLTMLVHLMMSGRLDVVPQDEAVSKHARVVWLLDDNLALRFDDARKFGRVYLTEHPETVVGKLGPDALEITSGEFVSRLLARRGALKPLLLDQTFIAGVGNIYADESLYLAKLHPKRTANTLAPNDAARLHTAIRRVLLASIAANGASFDWVYPGGNFQENFAVYGMAGKTCPSCGRPIERILVGQRSTHFCATCQPLM